MSSFEEFLFKHLGVSMNTDGSAAVDPRIIEAIKIYREKTGVGLAEAKSAVEEINRTRGF